MQSDCRLSNRSQRLKSEEGEKAVVRIVSNRQRQPVPGAVFFSLLWLVIEGRFPPVKQVSFFIQSCGFTTRVGMSMNMSGTALPDFGHLFVIIESLAQVISLADTDGGKGKVCCLPGKYEVCRGLFEPGTDLIDPELVLPARTPFPLYCC